VDKGGVVFASGIIVDRLVPLKIGGVPFFLEAGAGSFTPPPSGFDFLDPNNIGLEVEGGFFAGLISHTADGNPTHALIVAPAATGASGAGYTLTTNYAWKPTGTATAGTSSTFDGAANTAAMVAAGIADHPAAQFCVNLNIGGFTDWYFPALNELEIAYFNLKPSTDLNATNVGVNPYSVPARASNYTTTVPAQTNVTAFQWGQPEAFTFISGDLNSAHLTSTEISATNGAAVRFDNGGSLSNPPKTQTRRVRAFRRIAL
jgi:hypothetical protein